MALPITFNNTVFQAGFFGTDDGGVPTNATRSFRIDDVYDFPVTVNGTVTDSNSTVTMTYTLPGDTAPTTQTLNATNLDNPDMILFTGSGVPGNQDGSLNRYVFSNVQMYGNPPPAGQTRTTFADDGNGTLGEYTAPVCFTTGTLIRTVRGEIAVEQLSVGDIAVTASGLHRPIRWIGYQEIDCNARPSPETVWPIRIMADAIAKGIPARDLLVSPDHCLLFDDVLIPAKHLINDATVLQQPVDIAEYWHVELDSHEALFAEGVPAESYRDCGMHAFFKGGQEWGARTIGGASMPLLAPHVTAGPRLHAVKAWLIARAKHLGAQRFEDPGLEIIADGRVLTPISVYNRQFTYTVPEGSQELILRSRSCVPAHWIADNEDQRTLGVRVSDLHIDGAKVSITSSELSRGWNAAEPNGRERWTNGAALLPTCLALSFSADWFLGYPAVQVPSVADIGVSGGQTAPVLRLVANG